MSPALQVAQFKQSLNTALGMNATVAQLPPHDNDLAWFEAQGPRGVDTMGQAHAIRIMLDKMIAAHGSIFIGSFESTFTMDIFRLRVGLKTQSPCDSALCNRAKEWNPT